MSVRRTLGAVVSAAVVLAGPALAQTPREGGALPGPLPFFPPTNWWNLDISGAPVDANSASYISFIGPNRTVHPDFGGEVSPGSVNVYGFPYIVVSASQAKKAVQFVFADESDGVDHNTGQSFPFYPIPDQAKTTPHWIENGEPGNVDARNDSDRHMLILDQDDKFLYELYSVYFDGANWLAGSGAFFDMNTDNRRPEGWTSADAAGLAILPGLVRHDEVYGGVEIGHAFRVTVRATNGHVYPASHDAGSTSGALPMGARLRLKASKDISSSPPEMQRVFRAMKKYGLIVADNGSDMYVSGTFDLLWDNDVLNPEFGKLKASDFEVIKLGFNAAARVFASVKGSDLNDCRNATTPCRTLAQAVAQVSPGGEVIVLDTGSYGGLTIDKGVTIETPGGVVAFAATPVVVNAGASEAVVLRGLTIKAATPGTGTGVQFVTGGSLYVERCVIDGWNRGIDFAGDGGLVVTDSTVRNSASAGLRIAPTASAQASIDRSRFEGTSSGCGVSALGGAKATVRGSLAAGNISGFCASAAGAELSIQGSLAAHNTGSGVLASGGTARVTRSLVTDNGTGLNNSAGILASLGDSLVRGNANNVSGTITPISGR